MRIEEAVDVVVCGAGAAGLVLALELARRGIRFRLIERMEGPFPGSRGKGIQPRTLEIFEALGVLDRMAARGGPYPPLRRHAPDGSAVDTPAGEVPVPTPAEPYGMPLLLPQCLTESVLRERLCELGGRVEFGTALDAFDQDADGVTVTLQGPHGPARVRARYLAGTDGGRSTVRRLLGVDFPGKSLDVRALVADVALDGLARDAWHRFNEGEMERHLAICPLPGTDAFQVQAPVAPEGEVDLSAAGLGTLIAARSGRDDIRVRAVTWASVYHMNARLAARYRVGRVFLAGDAAHIHPPTGAQGLNTSVQDAFNLGWKLAAALAVRADPADAGVADRLLDSYEAERRPVAAAVLGLSTRLLEAAKEGDLRRGRDTRQLDVGYAGSPLALDMPARPAGLRAGSRAPDAPVRGAGGQPVRLFTLLRGTHWTLLAQGGDPAVPHSLVRPGLHIHRFGPGGDLVDVDGHFQAAYGLADGELALVRPDGYVGAIVEAAAADALGDYLRGAGLADRAA